MHKFIARYTPCLSVSVCPSVRLTHAGIVAKRLIKTVKESTPYVSRYGCILLSKLLLEFDLFEHDHATYGRRLISDFYNTMRRQRTCVDRYVIGLINKWSKEFNNRPHRRRTWTVHWYSPGGGSVTST